VAGARSHLRRRVVSRLSPGLHLTPTVPVTVFDTSRETPGVLSHHSRHLSSVVIRKVSSS
jgi:hypothetical protein